MHYNTNNCTSIGNNCIGHLDDRADDTYGHSLVSVDGHTLGHKSVESAMDQTPDQRPFHNNICTAADNLSDCIHDDTLDCTHSTYQYNVV